MRDTTELQFMGSCCDARDEDGLLFYIYYTFARKITSKKQTLHLMI